MTGKQYFQRALDADRRIQALSEQRRHLEEIALHRPGLNASGIRAQSGNHSALELSVVRLLDTEKKLAEQMDEYNQIILDAARTIEKIGDEKMRQVLSLRYLSGLRWEEIANKVGYTLRQTFRLHGRALAAAERVLGIR